MTTATTTATQSPPCSPMPECELAHPDAGPVWWATGAALGLAAVLGVLIVRRHFRMARGRR
jgi:hypothetical protein